MSTARRPAPPEPGAAPIHLLHADCWIFDLDDTLYPDDLGLFGQVSRRMTEFICRHLDLAYDAARALQSRYFREFGTTLRGLMLQDGVDAEVFLDFVHDIDLADLTPDPVLTNALRRLPGRKLVFTNGSKPHAERILARRELTDLFDGIVDIVASDFVPKPDPRPYRAMVDRYGIDAGRSVMVEDIARNLVPARSLGMSTVWVRTGSAFGNTPGDGIDHTVDDLPRWLAGVVNSSGVGSGDDTPRSG